MHHLSFDVNAELTAIADSIPRDSIVIPPPETNTTRAMGIKGLLI